MSSNYSGYIYLWYDTKAKFYYVGGHKGKVEDKYVCSSKTLLRAYNLRPETFRFKVLEYVHGDNKQLRKCEQKWLDRIKDTELMTTENVQNGTCRYYNVKKHAAGGNGHANKGKSHTAWNKGGSMTEEQKTKISNSMFAYRRKISEGILFLGSPRTQ